jgi:predicted Zn-dependent protease with MMP-like domain
VHGGAAALNTSFEQVVEAALAGLPAGLQASLSNLVVAIEDEPPPGEDMLGLYEGVPLTERSGGYAGELPDVITIFEGPLVRLAAGDDHALREEIRRTVLHELAHHFGIDDDRLEELDRY